MLFEDLPENKIPPPDSPLTIKVNQAILDFVFERFTKQYLPAFRVQRTSTYRSPEKNLEVGGAANSAHVHGLATDFVLVDKAGKLLNREQSQKVFNEFVKPHWPGFALWEKDGATGWHIHVNLSRNVGRYAAIFGISVLVLLGLATWSFLDDSKGKA